jgi:transposase
MIPITFPDEDIAPLKKEKDYNPFPKVRRRCHVMYLQSQGFKNTEIETMVGMSHGTVTNHLKLYHQGGLEAWKALHYKGQPSQLHRYTDQINASFETHPVGTLKEAKARIKDLTDLELSLPQIQYFLDLSGLKRRKVKQIPDTLDIEKQETFTKKNLRR